MLGLWYYVTAYGGVCTINILKWSDSNDIKYTYHWGMIDDFLNSRHKNSPIFDGNIDKLKQDGTFYKINQIPSEKEALAILKNYKCKMRAEDNYA
jgi:hypothetical protein